MTHYLIIGNDICLKEDHIASLKTKFLPSSDSKNFDYDVLYAQKTSSEELKRILFALPAVAQERLVVIRGGDALKSPQQDLLVDFVTSDQRQTRLIVEGDWTDRDPFVKKIRSFFSVKAFFLPDKENIFAVTRMLMAGRPAEALTVLHQIIDDGSHPLQIMGGLVWFWGKEARARMGQEEFEKGLLFLQEADLNIKRSRLPPEQALEVVISKMSLLLKR